MVMIPLQGTGASEELWGGVLLAGGAPKREVKNDTIGAKKVSMGA